MLNAVLNPLSDAIALERACKEIYGHTLLALHVSISTHTVRYYTIYEGTRFNLFVHY